MLQTNSGGLCKWTPPTRFVNAQPCWKLRPHHDTTTKLSLLAGWWKWLMTKRLWIKSDFHNALYVIGGGGGRDDPPPASPSLQCGSTYKLLSLGVLKPSPDAELCATPKITHITHTLTSCSTANWHTSANCGSSGSLYLKWTKNDSKVNKKILLIVNTLPYSYLYSFFRMFLFTVYFLNWSEIFLYLDVTICLNRIFSHFKSCLHIYIFCIFVVLFLFPPWQSVTRFEGLQVANLAVITWRSVTFSWERFHYVIAELKKVMCLMRLRSFSFYLSFGFPFLWILLGFLWILFFIY